MVEHLNDSFILGCFVLQNERIPKDPYELQEMFLKRIYCASRITCLLQRYLIRLLELVKNRSISWSEIDRATGVKSTADCGRVLQCDASVLQCDASVLQCDTSVSSVMQLCCSVMQVCCILMQLCCNMMQLYCSVIQWCCSVIQVCCKDYRLLASIKSAAV